MARITLQGNPLHTSGELPETGSKLPEFTLTNQKLQDVTREHYAGKKLVLNIVPSLDTGVCAMSLRKFNQKASDLENAAVITISADLPFAQARSCASNDAEGAETLSCFRHPEFGHEYGVRIEDGAFGGLLARAVVVTDAEHNVIYTELVPEIGQEPNYDAALDALS